MLAVGTTLGPYSILAPLGAGGMGEVYRAHDTRLGRDVAIKVLPSHLAVSSEVRARFEREARTISQLSHPHICTLFDVGHQNGIDYLVMELLEGETLARRLERGPLPVAELLMLGKQIAGALACAHHAGVVHRDLKPGNVMLTKGGAKLMDFGLARSQAMAQRPAAMTQSPTLSEPLTAEGTIVGTLQYMAPEQLESRDADARADIWALGCVLYEMATGERAFAGGSQASLIAAIMKDEPRSMTEMLPMMPPALERVILRCLAKDRDDRFQSAGDLAYDLGSLSGVLEKAPALPGAGRRSPVVTSRTIWMLAGFAALAIAAFVASLFLLRTSAPIAPLHWQQLTYSGKMSGSSALSPDGTMFAFVSSGDDRGLRVMVQDIAGGQPVEVFKLTGVLGLRWTWAGNALVVAGWRDSTMGVYLVPRMGGNHRTYVGQAGFAAPSPDDRTLAFSWSGGAFIRLLDTSRRDTSSIPVLAPRTWLRDGDWSPDGRHLLYLVEAPSRWSIWTTQRDGQQQCEVYRDSIEIQSPRWAPRGGAIYCLRRAGAGNELLRIRVTSDARPVHGAPSVLASDPQLGSEFSISRNGHRLLALRGMSRSSLWHWPRRVGDPSGPQREVRTSTALLSSPRISPDGRRVAYLSSEGVCNVHVLSLSDSSDTQVTFMKRDVSNILGWSPNGRSLAIVAGDGDTSRVWIVAADASTSRVLKKTVVSESGNGTWWPGRNILYQRRGNRNLAVLDPATELERGLVSNDSVGWMFSPVVSPDTVHVAVNWNRWPRWGTWVVSLADTVQRLLVLNQRTGPVFPLRWTPDGEAVVVRYGNRLVRVSTITGDTATVLRLPHNDLRELDITPDLQTLVLTRSESNYDLWYADDFDPETN